MFNFSSFGLVAAILAFLNATPGFAGLGGRPEEMRAQIIELLLLAGGTQSVPWLTQTLSDYFSPTLSPDIDYEEAAQDLNDAFQYNQDIFGQSVLPVTDQNFVGIWSDSEER